MSEIQHEPESAGLSILGQARALLANALTLDDAKDVLDRARALRLYAKDRQDGSAIHADAYEIVMRAERRIGEISKALPKAKPGPAPATFAAATDEAVAEICPPTGHNPSKGEVLRDLEITRQRASRYERIADIPDVEFDARVAAGRAKITRTVDAGGIVAPSSASQYDGDEFSTPAVYVEAARKVLGSIELDIASNAYAANVVRAERFWTKADNALPRDWSAKTAWLNPPYSNRLIQQFVEIWLEHIADGRIKSGIVLVNNATETAWFQSLLGACTAVCFPDHRIAFELNGTPIAGNRYAQTFFYFGPDLAKFAGVFSQFGKIGVTIMGEL